MKVIKRIPCRKKPAPDAAEQAKNAKSLYQEKLYHKKQVSLMMFPLSKLGDKPSLEMKEACEKVNKIKIMLRNARLSKGI